MVRLTADLIARSQQCLNPLKERELVLRGNKIPAIENLAVTVDGFDTIDLSDNEIRRLDNFPRMKRLNTMFANNNHIVRIGDLGDVLPNLHTLMLTGNKLQNLNEVDPLGKLGKLTSLSLIDNPVVRQPHYRQYVIYTIPSLKILDFRKIKSKDRAEAEKMFSNKSKQSGDKQQNSSIASRVTESTQKLTSEQQTIIKLAISKAKTNEDVDRLERMLLQGVTAEQLEKLKATVFGGQVSAKSQAVAIEVNKPAANPSPAPAAEKDVEPVEKQPSEDTVMEVENPTNEKTPFDWSSLKVVDLKKEAALRGLSKDGKKADIVSRLIENDPFKEKS